MFSKDRHNHYNYNDEQQSIVLTEGISPVYAESW